MEVGKVIAVVHWRMHVMMSGSEGGEGRGGRGGGQEEWSGEERARGGGSGDDGGGRAGLALHARKRRLCLLLEPLLGR
jgi:hypothetical protein